MPRSMCLHSADSLTLHKERLARASASDITHEDGGDGAPAGDEEIMLASSAPAARAPGSHLPPVEQLECGAMNAGRTGAC